MNPSSPRIARTSPSPAWALALCILLYAACSIDDRTSAPPFPDASALLDAAVTLDASLPLDASVALDAASPTDAGADSGNAFFPPGYCEADHGAHCYYVAADGDDTHPGTWDEPFKTFKPALVLVGPGDFIYARGGTYGLDNAMVSGTGRDPRFPASSTVPTCPEGETAAEGAAGWECHYDTYSMIVIGNFTSWATSAPSYSVRSGEPGAPITVKSFPGEKARFAAPSSNGMPANAVPCADCAPGTLPSAYTNSLKSFVKVSLKSYWVIEGFDMDGSFVTGTGVIAIGGGNSEPGETHDIVVRNNEIHDYVAWSGSMNNVGLIKIDRGDLGGPHEITIERNILHGMSDPAAPGVWTDLNDSIHYGAVTTLSRENYYGVPGGGTGRIVISGNTLYNLPQVFFFKNPSAGPIEIHDNVIYDSDSLGAQYGSNVHFSRNLVYDVPGGFAGFGNWWNPDPDLAPLNGQAMTVTFNTFVGLDSLISTTGGTGHTITDNVFFGLRGRASSASWDTPAFISFGSGPSDSLDPAQSLLGQIVSDRNCFLSPYADFQMASRYLRPELTGTGQWLLEHYDPPQALATFGYDPNSVISVQTDPFTVFVAPSIGNFELSDPSLCPGMGFYARL